jgi:glycyl-tRNA synthetase beta chain
MAEFLFEIGLEEIPARMIAAAQAELQRRIVAMLRRENLLSTEDENSLSFSTPRRLAVLVHNVSEKQKNSSAKVLGPAVKIAYKDGIPTPAAEAFARKNGIAVADLKTETTPKGDYLLAETEQKGRSASEVITAELPKELAAIYWAKSMYWRAGKPERFVRPVRWMAALLDATIVPVEFAGKTAANLTYGHRVLFGDSAIQISAPSDYAATLEAAFVLADVETRRHRIRKALDHVTRTVGGLRWREDHALVDKLTHLTEWASAEDSATKTSVILGAFEPAYLDLPEEVLVTVMRDHQSYFAVEDKTGKLAPYFLAVLNMEADEPGLAVIRHGNARVLRARFNDARFFWEFDQRVPLTDRIKLLENVTFQKDLGSYAAKSERVQTLCATLSDKVESRNLSVNFNALKDAAALAKTDLTSELVKEFTELQGIVGGLYARTQGFSAATADAIYDQYLPKSMEDSVPRTVEGALLAIADKADTIAGMFGLGLEPTGSKDPFALRRAANGIVKILAETQVPIPLSLGEVAQAAAGHKEEAVARLELFCPRRRCQRRSRRSSPSRSRHSRPILRRLLRSQRSLQANEKYPLSGKRKRLRRQRFSRPRAPHRDDRKSLGGPLRRAGLTRLLPPRREELHRRTRGNRHSPPAGGHLLRRSHGHGTRSRGPRQSPRPAPKSPQRLLRNRRLLRDRPSRVESWPGR